MVSRRVAALVLSALAPIALAGAPRVVAIDFDQPPSAIVVAGVTERCTLGLVGGGELVLLAMDFPAPGRCRGPLAALLASQTIEPAFDGPPRDRYGRLLAQVTTPAGIWVQGALLDAGLSRVAPLAGHSARLAEMLGREAAARARHAGLWSEARFRVRDLDHGDTGLDGDFGTFQVVEGRIGTTARMGKALVLGLGEGERGALRIVVEVPAMRELASAGLDPATLGRRRIRARGWLGRRDGPEMRLATAGAIEILDTSEDVDPSLSPAHRIPYTPRNESALGDQR